MYDEEIFKEKNNNKNQIQKLWKEKKSNKMIKSEDISSSTYTIYITKNIIS